MDESNINGVHIFFDFHRIVLLLSGYFLLLLKVIVRII